ncbi:glutathione peroxidase [Exiguobacterium sp. U13-1]|uniref:Glutathione peroxidase n=1 Tax=Exiguobacterium acetylicum TaxID=41170 RepID=A0ABX8GCI9_EXIAC|nr:MULTISPECIES: glutathione peroxidase [Exiguobacterium]AOT00384.1 glutathione peroxidase [Exiguobacterium sp. U13-1]QWB31345.1 glutathione peroxidase [Exiguobacterium acetylicum]
MQTVYDATVQNAAGETVSLGDYAGRVLVIVNTASKCGLVKQLGELQALYDKYDEQGVTVLGFPCDQFNQQEFANQEETMQFCQLNYGVTFPMFQKIDVNGPNEHPLYTFLKRERSGLLSSKIKWNYTKFLIDRQGRVVQRFSPVDSVQSVEKTLSLYL